MLLPKLVTTLKAYDRAQCLADLTAGVIVGVVALPLAIAFAIASGVTPERGLCTAIVAGFLISALGGSRVQIGGPTGAFVVIVFGIVQRFGIDGLIVATMMAGAILVALGLCRAGSLIKFIPHPLVIGFTSGIAIIIFSGEVRDLLGLGVAAVPADFLAKWRAFADHATTINPYAVLISALTVGIIVVWPRFHRRVPGPFVALLASTALAHIARFPVETIGTRFGSISAGLPHPALPHVTLARISALIAPALTIAALGAMESLLSAVVADGMIGSRHRSNMELIAQGIANMVTPLFGGIPATGAIARTATNVKNGGRTPIAGMMHAATLLLITLFFGRWAALIPLATLAGILVVVAYNMSEWRTFVAELRAPRSDVAVLVLTFALTVLVNLTVAIGVGLVAAAFLTVRRMAEVSSVTAATFAEDRAAASDPVDRDPYASDADGLRGRAIPHGVEVFEVNGPLFFGAAEMFLETLGVVAGRPRVQIIRLRNVPAIDSTGLRALRELALRTRRERGRLVLTELQPQPRKAIERAGLMTEIGQASIFDTIGEALAAVGGRGASASDI